MSYNRKAFSDDYATETFYFPLSVQVEDEDSEDLYNVSSDSVRWFEDEIQEAIDDYQSDIEMEKYLCDDNDAIQRKTATPFTARRRICTSTPTTFHSAISSTPKISSSLPDSSAS